METTDNNIIDGVTGVVTFFPTVEKKGVATISTYEFKNSENPLYNLRAVRDGGHIFYMYEGKYVRLHINGELMMSDTAMERKTNRDFIDHATGKVLIAGLGVGLIIHNIIDNPDITEITVIEKYQDVIDLVAPKFANPKLKVICADIFDWLPAKTEKYDTIYFDIWADITTDNLEQIKKLHNRFKRNLNRENKRAWMNSWLKEFLQALRRKKSKY